MPHYPCRVDGERDIWCVWSTIVDAPIEVGSEEDIKAHFRSDPERIKRLKKSFGSYTGYLDEATQSEWVGEVRELEALAPGNRAGMGEREMSLLALKSYLVEMFKEHGHTSL